MVAVSVVIPVYNGAAHLDETLNSVTSQTLREIEIICVDDGSTDESPQILAAHSRRDQRISVHTKSNGGSAVGCLVHALPRCTGQFFFYMSQDDLISTDCLESCYERACESDADAVVPRMASYQPSAGGIVGVIDPPFADFSTELSGLDAFRLSLDWQVHGFSLRKMRLVRELGYDPRYINGDEYTTRLFYLRSNKVMFSRGVFLYRQDNQDALTRRFTVRTLDWLATDCHLLDLMETAGMSQEECRRHVLGTALAFRQKRAILNEHATALSAAEVKAARDLLSLVARFLRDAARRYGVPVQALQLFA